MSTASRHLLLSMAMLSAWLILFLSGRTGGGAIHLLLAASLLLFPWRRSA